MSPCEKRTKLLIMCVKCAAAMKLAILLLLFGAASFWRRIIIARIAHLFIGVHRGRIINEINSAPSISAFIVCNSLEYDNVIVVAGIMRVIKRCAGVGAGARRCCFISIRKVRPTVRSHAVAASK